MFLKRFAILLSALLAFSILSQAQRADVSFVAGGAFASDAKETSTIICITAPCPSQFTIRTSPHVFYEGTGAVRLANFKLTSLHVELPVAGVPSASLGGTIRITSVFVTPSLRIKFAPNLPVSPFVSIGGGVVHYSVTNETNYKGALQFGGGADIKTGIPLLGFRAEVRDFVTGQPTFGVLNSLISPTQKNNDRRHNVLVGAGIVLRF